MLESESYAMRRFAGHDIVLGGSGGIAQGNVATNENNKVSPIDDKY